jgi:PmbA protein
MPALTSREIMDRVRTLAERSGAAQAETYLETVRFTEVRVRQREVELVRQSAIQGLGLRVFRDRRMGFMFTTDVRPQVLDEMVTRTVTLAGEASPRDENKISEETAPAVLDLEIHDDSVLRMSPEDLTVLARSAEENAFAQDHRVRQTLDTRCGVQSNQVHFSSTYIPYQTYQASACWLSVTAIASEGNQNRTGSFTDRKRIFADLETAERVGRKAGARAVARLGAAGVPSAKVPVIFDAEAAGDFLRGLFGAFSGAQAVEQRSFLAGKLGTPIASPLLTIVDDAVTRRGLGSRPFDGEGVQSRRNIVVDRGVLKSFLHTTVSARRMGVGSTGNAGRSYDSLPTAGPTNFYVDRGPDRLSRLIEGVPRGLLVTDLAGFGIDVVSGEFSQQVEGTWIEGGKLTKPVEGVTVGGKLQDMLMGIDGVASDLEFRNNVASPSIRFRELTIGGA